MLQGLELAEWFAADSPLGSSLDGFAPREGQAEMAVAIADAISSGENLIVEAGTGTGKTLAYLIPALLSGHRVILSTGTKTLQDQLFYRDLPTVSNTLGRPAKTVLLKGRANYLCLHRMHAAQQTDLPPNEHRDLRIVAQWSQRTRTGDIVEVDELAEDSSMWPRVTSTQENCLGNQCEFYDRCHVVAARQAAMQARVVVVNHHLLLADLLLKEEGFGELLPGSDAVIIDEAHQFPEIAQNFFNVALSSRSLLDLARDTKTEVINEIPGDKALIVAADEVDKAVRDLRLTLPRQGNNLLWDALPGAFEPALDELVAAIDGLIDRLGRVGDEMVSLKRCSERAAALIDRIEQITSASDLDGLRWVGLSRFGFALNFTPVDTATGLGDLLASQPCSWVFTSATLAVGEDFSHYQARLGLADTRTLQIPSPFDYANSGLLYLPANMPEPSSPNYTQKLLDVMLPIVQASRGRAFLLFTSYRALNEAAECIKASAEWDFPLLVQGDAPRSKLLEQFATTADPVLLGTASFWEGVDIRGDGLVLVCIDRLPFASPGDPLLKARLDAIARSGGQPFMDYQLPQAVLALKQGVGRLIRDTRDYGVVVIADPRLTGRSYGRMFLKSLPPFPVVRDSAAALNFFSSSEAANA